MKLEPISPRELNPSIPRDLETICLKCLNKRGMDRYVTASDLADDLQRFLQHQPILARPIGHVERFVKLIRRQPALTALTVASMVAALALVAVCVGQYYGREIADSNAELRKALIESERAKASEQDQKTQTVQALENVEQYLYANRIALAQNELERNDFGKAARLLSECSPSLRGWEWHHLKSRIIPEELIDYDQGGAITCLAFSPNGRRIALGNDRGNVTLVPLRFSPSLELPSQPQAISAVAFRSDGKELLTALASGDVTHWKFVPDERDSTSEDLGGARAILRSTKRLGCPVTELIISADGSTVFASTMRHGTKDPAIFHWKLDEDAAPHQFPGISNVVCMAIAPRKEWLAIGASDRRVRVYRRDMGVEVFASDELSGTPRGVAFSPDEKSLIAAIDVEGKTTEIVTYQTSEWKSVSIKRHAWISLQRMLLGKNESQMFFLTDGRIRLWNAKTDSTEAILHDGRPAISSFAFHQSTMRIASGGGIPMRSGDVRSWRLNTPRAERTIGRPGRRWNAIALSDDASRLATAEENGPARLWDVATGRSVLEFGPQTSGASAIAINGNQQLIVTGGTDRCVHLWNGTNGELIRRCETHSQTIQSLHFAPDGEHFLSVGGEACLRHATGDIITTIVGAFHDIVLVENDLDSTADLPTIVVAREGRIEWLGGTDGKPFAQLEIAARRLFASRQGKWLAALDDAGLVHLIDRKSRSVYRSLYGQSNIRYLTWSANGSRLMSLGNDGITFWDPTTGLQLGTFLQTENNYAFVTLCDQTLAAADSAGRLAIWKY